MARGFATGAAVLVALSVLGGCSGFEAETALCPTVGALDKAERLTRFRDGGTRDLTDVEFQAHIGSLAAECSFDIDTRVGSVDLDIGFRAQRGPAGSAAAHEFDYFVAVVDPEGGVATRKAFAVQVSFEGDRTEAARTEPLVLDIPVTEDAFFGAYRIYVGMQLTKEQFDRNLEGGG